MPCEFFVVGLAKLCVYVICVHKFFDLFFSADVCCVVECIHSLLEVGGLASFAFRVWCLYVRVECVLLLR